MRVSANRNDPNQPDALVPETVGAGLCIPVESDSFQTWRWTPCRGHGSHRPNHIPACSRAHDAVPARRRPGLRHIIRGHRPG